MSGLSEQERTRLSNAFEGTDDWYLEHVRDLAEERARDFGLSPLNPSLADLVRVFGDAEGDPWKAAVLLVPEPALLAEHLVAGRRYIARRYGKTLLIGTLAKAYRAEQFSSVGWVVEFVNVDYPSGDHRERQIIASNCGLLHAPRQTEFSPVRQD